MTHTDRNGQPSFPVYLQLFADSGDKTEKATPKKRQDARKKGQVMQSREVSSTLVLLFILVSLKIFGSFIYDRISTYTKYVLTEYTRVDVLFSGNELGKFALETMIAFLTALAPIFAITVITILMTEYAQVGFLFTLEPLKVQLSRINPLSGFKRMFSINAVFQLLKSAVKITIVVYIAYVCIRNEIRSMMDLMDVSLVGNAAYMCSAALSIGIKICVALVILAMLDYLYQWWQYEKNLRMSKQEIKEEYKQTEGNPEVKSKIKQKQRQISMRRMLQDVPKADVVITNPTHFAVAVKYDAALSDAPVVTAKGQDFIAMRIKEVARENRVEIVENKPLARTLYETVEIGESIPPELFQAVAEVLAFVYSLKERPRAANN